MLNCSMLNELRQHVDCHRKQRVPFGCQCQPRRVAHEQRTLVVRFQLLDLPTDRSLRAAQMICGLTHTAERRRSDERLKPG